MNTYAFSHLPIEVQFGDREGLPYPVIYVPNGVTSPIATKRDLLEDSDDDEVNPKKLIQKDTVYFRTYSNSKQISTTPACPKDWDRIAQICFENRESNIGVFLRRHLGDVNLDMLQDVVSRIHPLEPSEKEKTLTLLNDGHGRFLEACNRRGIDIPDVGTLEVAIRIVGDVPEYSVNEDFYWMLQLQKPPSPSMSPWIDTWRSGNDRDRPHKIKNGWETLFYVVDNELVFGDYLDFWRMEPTGRFYQLNAFDEDMPGPQRPTPKTRLLLSWQIGHVAESMAVGLSFARSMKSSEDTRLSFVFRWRSLENRELMKQVPSFGFRVSPGTCQQSELIQYAEIPGNTPSSSVAIYVQPVIQELCSYFQGINITEQDIERRVNEVLGNTM